METNATKLPTISNSYKLSQNTANFVKALDAINHTYETIREAIEAVSGADSCEQVRTRISPSILQLQEAVEEYIIGSIHDNMGMYEGAKII